MGGMRPRLQFSLRFLMVLVLAVSCFLAGAAWQKKRDEPVWVYKSPPGDELAAGEFVVEIIRLPDGSEWERILQGQYPVLPDPDPSKRGPQIKAPVSDE